MKRLKFAVFGIVSFVLCSLYATKPNEKSNDKFANNFIDKMSVEVVLTDSQKVLIIKRLKDFSEKLDSLNLIRDETQKLNLRVSTSYQFEQSLDSILTKEQKSILESNRKQRINIILNKYQSK